ncbi:hypothetical protein [Paratractidigestivibacter sp.]|nr:hypothetical protein [Paratractidigestivibacter sp.]
MHLEPPNSTCPEAMALYALFGDMPDAIYTTAAYLKKANKS